MSTAVAKDADVGVRLQFESEEEFEAWCDEDTRAEYLDGEVIMHSPAGTVHEDEVTWLATILRLFVDRDKLGRLFGSNTQIRLAAAKRRLADLCFVAQNRLDIVHPTYIDGAPDLIVEFVSHESTVRDWHDKYLQYQSSGVKEYWVIDEQLKRMDLHKLNQQGKLVVAEEESGKLFSTVLPGFWVKPEWFWQRPLPSTIAIAREIGII